LTVVAFLNALERVRHGAECRPTLARHEVDIQRDSGVITLRLPSGRGGIVGLRQRGPSTEYAEMDRLGDALAQHQARRVGLGTTRVPL
jgi:hypothetical protein